MKVFKKDSEESRGIREADDDGEDVRVLSNSSSDDSENGDDNDDGDDSDVGDGSGGNDNNGGNNSDDRGTYSLESHTQGLSLTSNQHYGVGYGYDYRPQLERSTSISIGLSTYRKDYYDFMPHRNSMWK